MIKFDFNILPNGDLDIVWDRSVLSPDFGEAEVEDVRYMIFEKPFATAFTELFESYWCSDWSNLDPAQIGALTDAPVIGHGVGYLEELWDDFTDPNSDPVYLDLWMERLGQDAVTTWMKWVENRGGIHMLPWYEARLVVDDRGIWWFPNYMVENPLETLFHTGHVTFTKVEEA